MSHWLAGRLLRRGHFRRSLSRSRELQPSLTMEIELLREKLAKHEKSPIILAEANRNC